jgi:hypothetical protein
MSSQPERGLASFMFHPYEFITKVDWDIVNFSHGANGQAREGVIASDVVLKQAQPAKHGEGIG